MAPDDDPQLRSLMFSIAYRMTGSVAESEDLVQEAFFRFERARRNEVAVEAPKAYLAATTTRLAIDHMRSARVRREAYVSTWLPEPIVTDVHDTPEEMAELSDSLSMAFLVLLERLSPVERAVFVLREVFDYPYEDIAAIVDKSEANCRQILARARQHVGAHRSRAHASREQGAALVRSFLDAARDGNMDGLVSVLAADVAFYGDGGGKASSVRRPLVGRERVASFVLALFGRLGQMALTLDPVLVNSGPGLIVRDAGGATVSVIAFDIAGGSIHALRGVVNPDKLQHLGPVSDLARLPGPRDHGQRKNSH